MPRIRPPKGKVECDSCDPECDEDGRPYTCYRCCDTGWMPEEFLWSEPQILRANTNPQSHFMARYPSPPQFYLTGRPAWMDDDCYIPF